MGEAEGDREGWGGQLEFILTLVGFAVGLGNVWRFPYLAYSNGGGAFLIPYICVLIFMGIPLFFMEVSIGQFASKSQIKIWQIAPIFKGVGFSAVLVASLICFYYNIVITWCFYYFFASMTDVLPWTSCGNDWNTPNCVPPGTNKSLLGELFNSTNRTSPAEEYFYEHVLGVSESIDDMGTVKWQLACLLALTWVIIFLVLLKGIQSLGKVSYVATIFPYILLTVMLVRGVTLEGSSTGINYYLNPEWERLTDVKVWSDAATQIFYSLGIAMGGLIAMASYNKFDNNILRDGLMIPTINCCTSIYAGFVIFSVLGYMSVENNVPIQDVAKQGPGLVFVVYPEGLATMPVAPLWSVLFFLMMIMLGFSSQFSTAEGVVSAFLDEFPVLQKGQRPLMMRALFCTICFLLGLPMTCNGGFYLFNIFNDYSAEYSLFVIAVIEVTVITWIYGVKTFSEDVRLMLGRPLPLYFKLTLQFISPVIMIAIIILKIVEQKTPNYLGVPYPEWAQIVTWIIALTPVILIPLVGLYIVCTRGGIEVVKEASKAVPEWGPADPKNRIGSRYELEMTSEGMRPVSLSVVEVEKHFDDVIRTAEAEISKDNHYSVKHGNINDNDDVKETDIDSVVVVKNGKVTKENGHVNSAFDGDENENNTFVVDKRPTSTDEDENVIGNHQESVEENDDNARVFVVDGRQDSSEPVPSTSSASRTSSGSSSSESEVEGNFDVPPHQDELNMYPIFNDLHKPAGLEDN